MIITLHFVIENFRFSRTAGGDKVLVEDVKDVLANVTELLLNLEHIRLII